MAIELERYQKYSEETILSNSDTNIDYKNSNCQLVQTRQGLLFFGRIGIAPSWLWPLEANYPYFHTPDSLCVFLWLENWVGMPLLSSNAVKDITYGNSKNASDWGARDPRISAAIASRLMEIEVFCSNDNSNTYYYVGQARLSGCGGERHKPEPWELSYHLARTLSREIWINFGGYSHWLLIIGEKEFTIRSYKEAAPLLDSYWGKDAFTLRITRYEGDVLRAGANENNQAGLIYKPTKGMEVYSGYFDRDCEWVWFNDDETHAVPESALIARKRANEIIKSYMTTGWPLGMPGYPE